MGAPNHILGLSAFYHDSAAALLVNGTICAAAQEERFTRRKNDPSFPSNAVHFCLNYAGLKASQLDAVVFYDKPVLKFTRLLETYFASAPLGMRNFPIAVSKWINRNPDLRKAIRSELANLRPDCKILFTEHHEAHAASAFYPSPFDKAAILTVDGVGEWATTTIGLGIGNEIKPLKEIQFPHSLGLLYSAFTDYCGFRINSGEYKLMGLAPYGEPKYAATIYRELIDVKPDGSFRLNLAYFNFLTGTTMTNEKFNALFGGPPRKPHEEITRRHLDVARSIQLITEEIMLKLAQHAFETTGVNNLCMAGGVALNCVANGKILRANIFKNIWIQPAAGDAGGALGAALAVWHRHEQAPLRATQSHDSMQSALLGPQFSDEEIETVLLANRAIFIKLERSALLNFAVEVLKSEKVVGWFQGRMEFGPRALGARSIFGDARSPKMQAMMNLKIKFRESFRPFAPIVRRDCVNDYFEIDIDSPYMLLVAPIKAKLRKTPPSSLIGLDLLKCEHSTLPAITHVDYSARIQTISHESNPLLDALLRHFENKTACGVLINTSFNIRGEPIVCTPADAYSCFLKTEMDYLIIGSYVLERAAQPQKNVVCQVEADAD